MSNRIKLLIIAGSLLLIFLIIIFFIITRSLQTTNTKNANLSKIETEKIKKYQTSENKYLTNQKKQEIAQLVKRTSESFFSDIQKQNYEELKLIGPISNNDFEFQCSNITNKCYIRKKSQQALEKLKEFLKNNNTLDIYLSHPSMFIITEEDLNTHIEEQENEIFEIFDKENYVYKDFKDSINTKDSNNKVDVNSNNERSAGGMSEADSTGETNVGERSNDFDAYKDFFKTILESLNSIENIEVEETSNIGNSQNNEMSTTYFNTVQNTMNVPSTLECPPNLGQANSLGYYLLPTPINNDYKSWVCPGRSWGSKTLICAFYTTAKRWHEKYPNSKFYNGDINASGHITHAYGTDVDIEILGNPRAGHITDSIEVNIEAGKMLIDTGVIKHIIFGDFENDPRGKTVRDAWRQYAKSKGLFIFDSWNKIQHDDHFHIRIYDEYKGPYSAPGC